MECRGCFGLLFWFNGFGFVFIFLFNEIILLEMYVFIWWCCEILKILVIIYIWDKGGVLVFFVYIL